MPCGVCRVACSWVRAPSFLFVARTQTGSRGGVDRCLSAGFPEPLRLLSKDTPEEAAMPNRVLCPKCHGQRTNACLACRGTGKRSIVSVNIGKCKECDGSGRRRCDVCGGSGEVEPRSPVAPALSSAVNEHQPSCFAWEEERGEGWKGSGATKSAINETKSSL